MRARLDPKEVTESKEQLIKIYKILIEGEHQQAKRSGGGTPQAQQYMMVEKSKLYDRIYTEFQMKIHHF